MRPRTLKLFTNRPHNLGFDEAEDIDATQTIEIGEDESVWMFLQAFDRARVLTARAFEGSTQVVVICTVYDVADIHTTQRALQRSRRRLSVPGLKWGDAVMKAEENDEAARVFLPFVMDAASVPNLLWSMLAREVGVRLNQLAHEFRAWRLNLRP